VVADDQPMSRRLAFNTILDTHPGQYPTCRLLHPHGAALQRDRAAQAQEPETENAQGKSHRQRHSAPDGTDVHVVSGARKRFRAEGAISLRSSSVRKSMVPNSRSQAGGPPMRAPMAK